MAPSKHRVLVWSTLDEVERDRRDTRGEADSRRRADESPTLPTLPTLSRDEQEVGWGDEPAARDEEWYRRERPPHHE